MKLDEEIAELIHGAFVGLLGNQPSSKDSTPIDRILNLVRMEDTYGVLNNHFAGSIKTLIKEALDYTAGGDIELETGYTKPKEAEAFQAGVEYTLRRFQDRRKELEV